MQDSELLKKYLENLILELKTLEVILKIEDSELDKGKTSIFDFTNSKRNMLLKSIKSHYDVINSWFKDKQNQEKDILGFIYLFEEINSKKQEIYSIFSILKKKISKLLKENQNKKYKIRLIKNIFKKNNPILIDLKI